jgi:3(or 17)beta-hydroxysteroid dehydrogenase
VLLNSAGIGLSKTVEEITLAEWRKVHAIDLDGVFLGCKHGVGEIKKHTARLGGSIINISSISGIIAGANMAAYNSAKAGVRLLSKSVALHCAKSGYNIRCNSVHPTFIDTPILDRYRDRFGNEVMQQKLGRQVPIGRLGRPEEVGWALVFLASDESSFMTWPMNAPVILSEAKDLMAPVMRSFAAFRTTGELKCFFLSTTGKSISISPARRMRRWFASPIR